MIITLYSNTDQSNDETEVYHQQKYEIKYNMTKDVHHYLFRCFFGQFVVTYKRVAEIHALLYSYLLFERFGLMLTDLKQLTSQEFEVFLLLSMFLFIIIIYLFFDLYFF